jgi:DNA-binding MarR family transcriptional regulator
MIDRDRITHLSETCVGINLRRAARAITNHYDQIFTTACGLRVTQIPPLVALYLAGPQAINQLAERLELDRTTLSRNLKILEQAGLVTIEQGEDQRTRLVCLTQQGRDVLLKALPVWEEAQRQLVAKLGEERFRTFLVQLSEVADHTQEA